MIRMNMLEYNTSSYHSNKRSKQLSELNGMHGIYVSFIPENKIALV